MCIILLALVLPANAIAAKPFLLGVVDDASNLSNEREQAQVAKLGLNAVRAVIHWKPGNDPSNVKFNAPPNVRVVLSVLAPAGYAPISPANQLSYCNFLADFHKLHPNVKDYIIWNEPGKKSYFWPSFLPTHDEYVTLLETCYNILHPLGVRVIGPAAHMPVSELTTLVQAIAARGKILDTFAIHPYNLVGQTKQVVALVRKYLSPTMQVWLTEHGIESSPTEDTRQLYEGTSLARTVTVGEQAKLLKRNISLAYCTPGVSGYFNFLLRDEVNLGWSGNTSGFQTGLLYPDWSIKPAFITMRSMTTQIRKGTVKCQ